MLNEPVSAIYVHFFVPLAFKATYQRLLNLHCFLFKCIIGLGRQHISLTSLLICWWCKAGTHQVLGQEIWLLGLKTVQLSIEEATLEEEPEQQQMQHGRPRGPPCGSFSMTPSTPWPKLAFIIAHCLNMLIAYSNASYGHPVWMPLAS